MFEKYFLVVTLLTESQEVGLGIGAFIVFLFMLLLLSMDGNKKKK